MFCVFDVGGSSTGLLDVSSVYRASTQANWYKMHVCKIPLLTPMLRNPAGLEVFKSLRLTPFSTSILCVCEKWGFDETEYMCRGLSAFSSC